MVGGGTSEWCAPPEHIHLVSGNLEVRVKREHFQEWKTLWLGVRNLEGRHKFNMGDLLDTYLRYVENKDEEYYLLLKW